MFKYLIRNSGNDRGYSEITASLLPRSREESYFPWAMALDGRVVYANTQDRHEGMSGPGLSPYTRSVGMKRRAEAQSALGLIALENPQFYVAALKKVSSPVKSFLLEKFLVHENALIDDYAAGIGKYAYGMKYSSFGRFSDHVPEGAQANKKMWRDALDALSDARPMPTLMNIHDNVPSKLFKKYASETLQDKYRLWAATFRADREGELFYDDSKDQSVPGRGRGRADRGSYGLSTVGGMIAPGDAPTGWSSVQAHNRGVDMFKRIAPHYSPTTHFKPRTSKEDEVMRNQFSSISYYRDLDTRNELFGAGPSGTTGTLLASAKTFANLTGEDLKQYCFAIMGYLVGGGCHSLHESLTVMGYLPELEYNSSSMLGYSGTVGHKRVDGSYPLLPASFKNSHMFKEWQAKYYDISVLGGIHWMLSN